MGTYGNRKLHNAQQHNIQTKESMKYKRNIHCTINHWVDLCGCLKALSEIDLEINLIKLDRSVAAIQPQASSQLHSPQQKIVTRTRQI